MPFKIVRNDITKMQCDAIVNTANEDPAVGPGCDMAIYKAAGYEELLAYRKEKIGHVPEGQVFWTPAFDLDAKFIVHAVSPHFIDGESGEEEKLRSCYRKSLELAHAKGAGSIAFPLIATGSFGYPKEEGMRIALDEINAFLMGHSMLVYLVVFSTQATRLGERLYPDLEAYIDHNYVRDRREEEYGDPYFGSIPRSAANYRAYARQRDEMEERLAAKRPRPNFAGEDSPKFIGENSAGMAGGIPTPPMGMTCAFARKDDDFTEHLESSLRERMSHMTDTFSEYLLYLIEEKGMTNAQVYKRAIVDKKVFSKIKNNPDYHPQKMTAMCLCIGAELNLDETRDLLARAGYALSPCDKTDVIFTYFIEQGIYDMIELDIQLEEHGLKCLIS